MFYPKKISSQIGVLKDSILPQLRGFWQYNSNKYHNTNRVI